MGEGGGGVVEVVERTQLFLEQKGAVEAAVGGLDLGELGGLAGGVALGCLDERPADALDPLAAGSGALAVVVPGGAADLVDGLVGELDDVEGSKQTSALGSASRIAFS